MEDEKAQMVIETIKHTIKSSPIRNNPMDVQAIYGRTFHGSVPSLNVAERYTGGKTERNPSSIIKVNTVKHNSVDSSGLHPTQKPVALFEYLIRTYTNEGDTVMDNCAGSFTTAIACINTNREYICIEKDEKYFEIGKNRIANYEPLLQMMNT